MSALRSYFRYNCDVYKQKDGNGNHYSNEEWAQMLKGNLNFIWNSGWFHIYPGWDTDDECSFSILNADGEEIYASTGLQAGVLLTYENDCETNDVAEIAPNESVVLHPNPVNNVLYLDVVEGASITVFDMTGRMVKCERYTGQLDMSQLVSGLYFIKVDGLTVRFVKK